MQTTKTRNVARVQKRELEPIAPRAKKERADRYERQQRPKTKLEAGRHAPDERAESLLSVQAKAADRRARDRFSLILIGPPGSGKGTQAALLAKRYKVPHISTGDLLRDPKTQRTELGKKAKAIMEKGKLVPDSIMMKLVEQRLAKADCARGFILDGFPRTLRQAKSLDALLEKRGRAIAHVLFIDVADEVCVNRVLGRSAQAAAQGGQARADDNEATARVRLATYHAQTEDALAYYRERGVVRAVDGERGVEEISAELNRHVGRPARRRAA